MGGRQSSQHGSHSNSPMQGSSRLSTASLDTGSIVGRSSGGAIEFSSDRPVSRRRRRRDRNDQFIEAHSLPSHLFPFLSAEIKCPVCNKKIGTNEIESHLLACLSKPRVSYNEDVLKADAGECIICFDDMITGEHIARLPCLCIYHKKCLDDWFNRNRCCPAHPDQIPQEYADTPSASSASVNTTNEMAGAAGGAEVASPAPQQLPNNLNNVSSISNDSHEDQPGIFRLDEQQRENETGNSGGNVSNVHEVNTQAAINNTSPATTYQRQGQTVENMSPTVITNQITVQESSNPVSIQSQSSLSLPTNSVSIPNVSVDVSPSSSSTMHGNTIPVTARPSLRSRIIVEECGSPPIAMSSSAPERRQKPIVHVDDGSIHGSPSNLNEEEIAQLASKIFVSSPRRYGEPTSSRGSSRGHDGT